MSFSYCTLELYKNTKFYPNQNYKIDSIDDFLNSLMSSDCITYPKLQYFKPLSLIKEMKLQVAQTNIKNFMKYNYARIYLRHGETASDIDWTLYYFVTKLEWMSTDCVKLTMQMDTLNTFMDTLEFSPKTMVEREHIDRWDYGGYKKDTSNNNLYILKHIPYTYEGLNPQKYYQFDIYGYPTIMDTDIARYHYINPISNTISSLADAYIANGWVIEILKESGIDEIRLYPVRTYTMGPYTLPYFKISDSVKKLALSIKESDISDGTISKKIIVPYAPDYDLFSKSYTHDNPYYSSEFIGILAKENSERAVLKYNGDFDGITFSGGYNIADILFPEDPELTRSRGYIQELIKQIFIATIPNYNSLISEIKDNNFCKQLDYSNESSMYSSEFFDLEFNYDVFDYRITFEDYKWEGSLLSFEDVLLKNFTIIKINYFYNLGVRQSFGFEFQITNQFKQQKTSIINGNCIYITVNNNSLVVNSDYLNYMRNGYNYDVKIKDINAKQRDLSAISNVAGGVVKSAIVGGVVNPVAGVIGGIGTAISGATQFQQNYYEGLKEDIQLEKNLAQLKATKIDISDTNGGIDRIQFSRRSLYLGFCVRTINKEYWKTLSDYFYYYGNRVRKYKIPSHNNRCLFDYLKCTAEFVNRNNVPSQECLQDIIQRCDSGITYIHKYLNTWTFDYDYKENVENALLDIIRS